MRESSNRTGGLSQGSQYSGSISWWIAIDANSTPERFYRGKTFAMDFGYQSKKDSPPYVAIGDTVYVFCIKPSRSLLAWGYITELIEPSVVGYHPHGAEFWVKGMEFTIEAKTDFSISENWPISPSSKSLIPIQISPSDAARISLKLQDAKLPSPEYPPSTQVFISYARQDQEFAQRLEKELRKRSLQVWIDMRIEYGTRWANSIEKALEYSSCCIVIMSDSSADSTWVAKEIKLANKHQKVIFPILLSGNIFKDLSEWQILDLREREEVPEKWFESVRRAILQSGPFRQ